MTYRKVLGAAVTFEQLPLLKRPTRLVSSVAKWPMMSPRRLPLLVRDRCKLKAFSAARVGDRMARIGEVACVKLDRRLRRRGRTSREPPLTACGDATGVVCRDWGVGVTLLRVSGSATLTPE